MGKSFGEKFGCTSLKARERIRRVEVKPNQNKISLILALIIELT